MGTLSILFAAGSSKGYIAIDDLSNYIEPSVYGGDALYVKYFCHLLFLDAHLNSHTSTALWAFHTIQPFSLNYFRVWNNDVRRCSYIKFCTGFFVNSRGILCV